MPNQEYLLNELRGELAEARKAMATWRYMAVRRLKVVEAARAWRIAHESMEAALTSEPEALFDDAAIATQFFTARQALLAALKEYDDA